MIETDPWQPKLWCGTHDRDGQTERELAEAIGQDEEDSPE